MGRVKDSLMGMGGIDAFYLPDNYEDWDGYVGYDNISCTHEFPDTGLLKSWCKFCGVEAEWSREEGKYIQS